MSITSIVLFMPTLATNSNTFIIRILSPISCNKELISMRSLGKLLKLKYELSQYEIDSLADYLSPIFDRYEDDRICTIYI